MNAKFGYVLILSVASSLWGCGSIRVSAKDMTFLGDCKEVRVDTYECKRTILEAAYDEMVNCQTDLDLCKIDLDADREICIKEKQILELQLRQWWRNPLWIGGGGVVIGLIGGLLVGGAL